MKQNKSTLDIGKKTLVMGILNITPDSFSDGGQFFNIDDAVSRAREMEIQGADILDIGAESSRPGSKRLSVKEEKERLLPVLKKVAKNTQIPISIDTYKSEVAREALKEGASIINDISGLHYDSGMAEVVAEFKSYIIIMHIKGTPETMQDNPVYNNILDDIKYYLEEGIKKARKMGVKDDKIIIDPGIGFGKTTKDNIEIINNLDFFKKMGFPLLLGTSRKSLIGSVLGLSVDSRLEGTAATVAIGIDRGVDIVRVHDVKEIVRVTKMTDAIVREDFYEG